MKPEVHAVWINGAFGAGKTELARQLARMLEGAVVYDPEETGFLLRRILPPAPDGDFQNYPSWRRLVPATVIELHRATGRSMVIPMTVVNPDYATEIFGAISASGVNVLHVFLDPGEAVLQSRIESQVLVPTDWTRDAEVRRWRLQQIPRCMAFANALPRGILRMDSSIHSPNVLAEMVISLAGWDMRMPPVAH